MKTETNPLRINNVVFFNKIEQYWDNPYVMKRHHVYDTRSVTLQGRVISVEGNEFKAFLLGNIPKKSHRRNESQERC